MTIKNNILTAENKMVLTNGKTFGKTVRLGRCGAAECWWEITEAEYEKILKEQGKETE